jgi:hypothetical protein
MLTDVLFDKGNLSVRVPVSAYGEFANRIRSITFNLIIEHVQVINYHFMIFTVLLVYALPDFVGAGHLEGTTELLESPRSSDLLPIELAIIEDLVLSHVLLLEVSEAVGLNEALETELADIVEALSSHDFTGAGLKAHPGHVEALSILLVVAHPDGIALELIRGRHEVIGRGDAHGVWHLVAHHGDVHD